METTRWEYKLIDSESVRKSGGVFKPKTTQDIEGYLNRLGRSGWEIVSMDFADVKSVFFGLAKRPLPTEWEPLAQVHADTAAAEDGVEPDIDLTNTEREEQLFASSDETPGHIAATGEPAEGQFDDA